MALRYFEIYAPLREFDCWTGSDFELVPGLWIRRFKKRPDLRGLDSSLAQEEQEDLFFAQHWLTFCWDEGAEPSPAETVNVVLLAFWLAKPTRTHVALRFQLGQDAAAAEKSRQRLLDRFAWVPGATHDGFEKSDLETASSYYRVLRDLCCARGRLNDALILTLAGCWSHRWQVALICHAASAEAILTYATGPGITRRLATAYACLVETQQAQRDAAFREFAGLYAARSDIMHGRTHNVPASDRLPTLARFGELIRNLWRVVLLSPQLITVLDGTDAQREAHFLALQTGYAPP